MQTLFPLAAGASWLHILLGAALVLAAAMALCAYGRRHAVLAPVRAHINALQAHIAVCENEAEREEARLQVMSLAQQASQSLQSSKAGPTLGGTAALFACFALCLASANSIGQALSLCAIVSVLWLSVSTDLACCEVMDVDVFALALVCGWATLLVPSAQWADFGAVVMGFVAIGTLVVLATMFFRIRDRLAGRAPRGMLGDGDVLVLFALTLYFGLDVIAVLFFACVAFVIAAVAMRMTNLDRGLPFVPAIFLGVLMVIVTPRPELLDFNQVAMEIYSNLYGA